MDLLELQRARRLTGSTQCLLSSSDSFENGDFLDDNMPDVEEGGEEGGEGKKRKRKEKEGKKRRGGFVPGSRDLVRVLRVSQQLYGREEQVKRLTNIYGRVCDGETSSTNMVLVHGYSGVCLFHNNNNYCFHHLINN